MCTFAPEEKYWCLNLIINLYVTLHNFLSTHFIFHEQCLCCVNVCMYVLVLFFNGEVLVSMCVAVHNFHILYSMNNVFVIVVCCDHKSLLVCYLYFKSTLKIFEKN